jgi:soluble lytic murein transglycosylase-like protein
VLEQINVAIPQDAIKLGKAAEDTSIRYMKLRKAARDFEALFVYQLLKTMRASFASNKKTEAGFGKDMFVSIADQALSDKMSESGALGIGQLLLASFEGRNGLHGKEAGSNGDDADPFVPLNDGRSLPSEMRSPSFMRLGALNENRTATKPQNIDDLIKTLSGKHGLPAELVNAVIQIESAGDRYAVSSRGAKGLMQLTDSTATELGVSNVFDPEQNIDAGSQASAPFFR